MMKSGTADRGKEVWAVIPARGGSKGLFRKNLTQLGGVPLVAWSIRAALEAENIDRVFVSTDDAEIAQIASEYGAEVPFLRPASLATDTAAAGDAVLHLVQRLCAQGEDFGVLLTLFPTAPFRTPILLRTIVELLQHQCCSLSVYQSFIWSARFLFGIEGENAYPLSARHEGTTFHNRNICNATIKEVYLRHAHPEKTKRKLSKLEQFERIFDGERRFLNPRLMIPVQDDSYCVDIDTEEDLRYAERLLELGCVSWTPDSGGLGLLPNEFLKIEEDFVKNVVVRSTKGTDEIQLRLAELGSPRALRQLINQFPQFKDVAVSLTTKESDWRAATDGNPLLVVQPSHMFETNLMQAIPLVVRAIARREPTNPCQISVVGDIHVEIDNATIVATPKTPIEEKDLLRATAYDSRGNKVIASSICCFEGGRWTYDPLSKSVLKDTPWEISAKGSTIALPLLDQAQIIQLEMYREHWRPESAIDALMIPIELPGWLELRAGHWTNMRTGERIYGRQAYPEIVEWQGQAFLPARVEDEATWKIEFTQAPRDGSAQ